MNNAGSNTEVGGWGVGGRGFGLKGAVVSLAILMAVPMAETRGLAGDQIERDRAPGLKVTVRVYTFAQVSAGDLASAERVASELFEKTGVTLSWVTCAQTTPRARENSYCQSPNAPTEIFLRVLPDFLEARYVPKSAMGYAVPIPPPDRGYIAGIALERAQKQLLYGRTLTLGQLLGLGMAHEIGHLLLGTNSHSPSGLMCAHWGTMELRLAARGQLNFSAAQAETIRADVQARSRDQASRQQAGMPQALPSAPAAR